MQLLMYGDHQDHVPKTIDDDCSPTHRLVPPAGAASAVARFAGDDRLRRVDVVTTTTASGPGRLRRQAVALAWLTVVWNAIEAVVAIIAGRAAGSLVLVGFGLDSTIEVASAAVIIWQFSGLDEEREQRALRFIAVSFFALAAYVTVQVGFDLVDGREPESSARDRRPDQARRPRILVVVWARLDRCAGVRCSDRGSP